MHFAATFLQQNPGSSFCYISGAATDSTEKGKLMWARVKGKTENDLMKMNFKQVYNLRPAFIIPTKGLKKYIAVIQNIRMADTGNRIIQQKIYLHFKGISNRNDLCSNHWL